MKRHGHLYVVLLFGVSMWWGCATPQSNTQREELAAFMTQEIDFSNLYSTEDSVKNLVQQKSPKIIHYIDSAGCVSCKLSDLRLWSVVRARMRTPVFFIVQTRDILSTQQRLDVLQMRFPTLYDTAGLFRTRHLIQRKSYQSFLLNPDNRPTVIGDPIGNDKLWQLYEQEIQKMAPKQRD